MLYDRPQMTAIIPQWEDSLKTLFTDPLSLLAYLNIAPSEVPWSLDKPFSLRVPLSFAKRMKKGDPDDPLLKQVLSVKLESQKNTQYSCDPLQEQDYNPLPGLLHKYRSRVLLTFAPTCAVHCRYCFRRHFPYENNNPGRKGWGNALEYIASHPEIMEVILSGGDPLMASDDSISLFLSDLEKIPHIKFLRFHTRLPVVIPERIHSGFAHMLSSHRFITTLVYHMNHAAEMTASIAEGVKILQAHHIRVLNQSVLLKGINDSVEALADLSVTLYSAGIIPYYIHLLDRVEGAAHFEVPLSHAKTLQIGLRNHLPGYLVPTFAKETPGAKSKVPL